MAGTFLVGVSALIERDNRILLLRRSALKDHGANEWEPVSGRVESGESAAEAVVREVLEETGLRVEVITPFDTFAFRRQPELQELIGIAFYCKYIEGELILSHEHSKAEWVPVEELLQTDVILAIRTSFTKFLEMKRRWDVTG